MATASISKEDSCPSNAGITPIPFVTAKITLIESGLISFRFGPILPDDPASVSVWQRAQLPFSKNIFFPSR